MHDNQPALPNVMRIYVFSPLERKIFQKFSFDVESLITAIYIDSHPCMNAHLHTKTHTHMPRQTNTYTNTHTHTNVWT